MYYEPPQDDHTTKDRYTFDQNSPQHTAKTTAFERTVKPLQIEQGLIFFLIYLRTFEFSTVGAGAGEVMNPAAHQTKLYINSSPTERLR